MRAKRMKAVQTVTPLFQAAEVSIDRAATESAECIAAMLKSRTEGNLPIGTGAEMLRLMTEALAANMRARDLVIQAHQQTPEVIREMGLTRMYGDEYPCPVTGVAEGSVIAIRSAA